MSDRPASANATQDGVVLLHGISRTARSFRKMQTALERAGFATLNLDYASRRKALEALAEDIHPAIERFAERHRRLRPFRLPFHGRAAGARLSSPDTGRNVWAAS